MQKKQKNIVDIIKLFFSFSTLKKINYWFLILYAGLFLSVITLYELRDSFNIENNVFKSISYIILATLYSYLIHIVIKKMPDNVLVYVFLLVYLDYFLFFFHIPFYGEIFIICLLLLLIMGFLNGVKNDKNNK